MLNRNFYIITFNILYCLITGFLTLDPRSNELSFLGSVLLSILLGYIVSEKTYNLSSNKKFLVLGVPALAYLLIAIFNIGFLDLLKNGFLVSIMSYCSILYFNKSKILVKA